MNVSLKTLDKSLKKLLTVYLIVVAIGISIGIAYLGSETDVSKKGIVEQYNGSTSADEIDIPDKYPKGIKEMFLTTHNHILGLAPLLLSLGLIIYFSTINRKLKMFLLYEPLISLIVTFGSIWLVRFIHPDFVYLTILSAILMYSSIYLSIGLSIYELNFLRNK